MFTKRFRVFFLGLAALHTVVVAGFFRETYQAMVLQGWYNTVGQDPMRAAAVWTLLFGGLLAVIGALLPPDREVSVLPAALLTATCALGWIAFPVSGFALATPVAGWMVVRAWRAR